MISSDAVVLYICPDPAPASGSSTLISRIEASRFDFSSCSTAPQLAEEDRRVANEPMLESANSNSRNTFHIRVRKHRPEQILTARDSSG
jgi:hypothetical protein